MDSAVNSVFSLFSVESVSISISSDSSFAGAGSLGSDDELSSVESALSAV